MNGGCGISYEIALRWMPLDLTDDKSTLVQVMAWFRQAPSHYLNQCWPRSMSPNGITRPQWVDWLAYIDTTNEVNIPHGKCILMQFGSLENGTWPYATYTHQPSYNTMDPWLHNGWLLVQKPLSSLSVHAWARPKGPLLLTWFNFNPSMDK